MRRVVHIGGALALLAACERPLDPEICPDIGVGELVVSEVRGDQSDDDPDPEDEIGEADAIKQGTWIELYNASTAPLDLYAVELVLRRLDGSGAGRIIVRRTLNVAPGDRVVLSKDDVPLPHGDYAWLPDFDQSMSASLAIDVMACDLRVDRVVIDDLPGDGTWSLGVEPPDADANDVEVNWCNDETDDADPFTWGLPGTPGASNNPCPTPP